MTSLQATSTAGGAGATAHPVRANFTYVLLPHATSKPTRLAAALCLQLLFEPHLGTRLCSRPAWGPSRTGLTEL